MISEHISQPANVSLKLQWLRARTQQLPSCTRSSVQFAGCTCRLPPPLVPSQWDRARCKWPRLQTLEQHKSALRSYKSAALYSRASLGLFTCAILGATTGEGTSSTVVAAFERAPATSGGRRTLIFQVRVFVTSASL